MLPAFLRQVVSAAARRMPLESPGTCTAGTVLFGFGGYWLLPRLEQCARSAPLIRDVLRTCVPARTGIAAVHVLLIFAATAGAGLFQARCLQLCFPNCFGSDVPATSRRRRGRAPVCLAGMPVGHDDLKTSILVTGVTGSSKTAGILLPALAQLLAAYNREDATPGGGREKLGAFIPEVKGDLVDAAVYLAHEAGRCVCRDVLIVTPGSRIPVVRYRDERGRSWFLSGRGGAGGSDAGDWLPALVYPAGHRSVGRPVPRNVFDVPEDCEAILPEWRRCVRPLAGARPRFVGWRWSRGNLVRVRCTRRRDEPDYVVGADGQRKWAQPPRSLAAEAVEFVDNGVHYNLIDARLPPAEAAERLTRLAAMARGGGSRGENEYFYEQGRKLIAACLSLHRAVAPGPATAVDLVRLATQEHELDAALRALDAAIAREAASVERAAGEEAEARCRRRLGPLRELAAFFHDEWQKMVADGKTANVIKSTISAAFDAFLHDPDLADTFCQPSTFSFEDLAQDGRIVALVPGERYEQIGRLLGTACKLDFQSAMLARTARADLNATRLVVYFADECHKYAAGGSAAAGDPYFMNLSRSNQVANICATQSYAWLVEVLGRDAANVYISAFGVQFWLQQTDPETCRRAAEICGSVTRERVTAEHEINFAGLVGALGRGREMAIRHRRREEDAPRFRPEDFGLLDVGEAVGYNKGRSGRYGKVVRGRVEYHDCTRPSVGPPRIQARMREYYREVLENLAFERGETDRWDADRSAQVADATPLAAEFAAYTGLDAGATEAVDTRERWAEECGTSRNAP